MNKKFLFSIIALAIFGGLFSVVYAGPIVTLITFAGNTVTTGSGQVDGDLNVDGTISGATIDDLQSQINSAGVSCQNQIAIKAQIPAFELSPECIGEDNDSDGFTSDVDCDDNDPLINPGAEDLPDDLFVDSNCDGIDGDESNAIFISTSGDDSNPGTKTQPKLTINSGIATAISTSKTHVYVSDGIHASQVNLANGISMWGKFDPTNNWARSGGLVTTITNSIHENGNLFSVKGIGILTPTTFADFTVQTPLAGLSGASTYGLYCNNCDALSISSNSISAGIAGNGLAGVAGPVVPIGNTGSNGNPGSCDAGAGSGGPGGPSPVGSAGGFGGNGGPEGPNDGQNGNLGFGPSGGPGGLGGPGCDASGGFPPPLSCTADAGTNGQPGGDGGIPGSDGLGGAGGSVIGGFWLGNNGDDGDDGIKGSGGGGGGGGGGQGGTIVNDGGGNGAGGGGAGGLPGEGGNGGVAGGGSFGLFLVDSTGVQLIGNTIDSDDGGVGGAGGSGGIGGTGGPGGNGASVCTGEVGEGGDGGAGGAGSNGGHGAGGAGGPSYSVYNDNTVVSTAGNTLTFGTGGLGGVSPGNDGSAGASGTVN